MKKQRENKGITLVALVITIIILLILAGISISALIGENGILRQVTISKEKTEIAQEKEAIQLAYMSALIGSSDITAETLNKEFTNNGTKATASGTGTLRVEFTETGREYNVDSNGNITGPIDGESIELNEYGFYFEQLYVVQSGNQKMGYVMHEDGTAEIYSDGGLGGDLFCTDIIESGIIYSEKQVIINYNGIEFVGQVSDDGLTVDVSNLGILTCTFEEIHGLYVDRMYKYEGIETDNSGNEMNIRLEFLYGSNEKAKFRFFVNDEIYVSEGIPIDIEYDGELLGHDHLVISEDELSLDFGVSANGKFVGTYLFGRNAILSLEGSEEEVVTETVTNPYGDDVSWVKAWTYSEGTWNTVEAGGTAEGEIVGKLYATGNETRPNDSFEVGPEYKLVIEGNGNMPDFTTAEAWLKDTTLWGAASGTENGEISSDYITELIVCDGITSVSANSFAGLIGLNNVKISSTVQKIGENAFIICQNLTNINIPNKVTDIGDYAFNNCKSLTSVTIPKSLKSIGDGAFQACENLLSITIPYGVSSIGADAFLSCTSLKSVTIPNSVISIGEGAFCLCTSLTNITIPNSVTSISDNLFDRCDSLASVNIPSSVNTIGKRAFYSCDSLTSINIPSSVTSIGWEAFAYCVGLKSVTIPNGVTSIEENTFWNCTNLTSVDIPSSITSIGEGAFYNCSSLLSIDIPELVTDINFSFSGCSSLKTVRILCNDLIEISAAFLDMAEGSVIYVKNSVVLNKIKNYHYDPAKTTITLM